MNLVKINFYACIALLLNGCMQSMVIPEVKNKPPISVRIADDTKVMAFERGVVKINRGEQIGVVQAGLACVGQPGGVIAWKGGRVDFTSDEMIEIFNDELAKENYKVVGDTKSLFGDNNKSSAELLVAALITDIKMNVCYPMGGFGNWSDAKGDGYIKAQWQIFSPLDKREIFKVETEGTSSIRDAKRTGAGDILYDAFSAATKNLLANKEFNDIIAREKIIDNKLPIGPSIKLTNVPHYNSKLNSNITDIKIRVATIRTSLGHGSGFIVGSDYLLTNKHVVGGAKYVKVITVTGRELVGEVIRSDAVRDVALIKTEPLGIDGLPINLNLPNVGNDVYAIGTPLKEQFSGTVTKGIVSGFRVEGNVSYIQSDASVQPGNSGGPLLDENGNVVALSVSGYFVRGATTSINYFIPIAEALRALGLELISS